MRQALSPGRGVLLLIVLLAAGAAVRAQDTASLRGTITDQSGGVIVGAKIKLTNTNTNISRTGTSGNDGGYLFTTVPVGPYSLTVTHANFQTTIQAGIVLELNQNGRVDVAMKLGESSMTVEVTATVAQGSALRRLSSRSSPLSTSRSIAATASLSADWRSTVKRGWDSFIGWATR